MIKFISATILISLYSFVCEAQEYRDSAVWRNIESSILRKNFLTSTRNKIEQLKPEIWKAKDYPSLARFYYYQMLIDDMRTEDTLFFKNSAFIDSLLEDKGSAEALKTLLHVMQAKRLSVFRYKDLKFNRKRYEIRGQQHNYAILIGTNLDSAIRYHFEEAKKGPSANIYSSEEMLWLSSAPLSFLFHPLLMDVVIDEELRYIVRDGDNYLRESEVKHWMGLSPDDFIKEIDSLKNAGEHLRDGLSLYSEWWTSHRNDQRIYYCIEQLCRRYVCSKFVDDRHNSNKEIQDLYETYLKGRVVSPIPEARILAIPELCAIWSEKGSRYAPKGKYYYGSYGEKTQNGWDTAYQYLPAKALQLYEDNRPLFENHPDLQHDLLYTKTKILSKELTLEVENKNLPGFPLLIKLQYKNIPHIYYRFVKVNVGEKLPVSKSKAVELLLTKAIIRDTNQVLPLPPDHNRHQTLMKAAPLAAGNYYMLFTDHPLQAGDSLISYQPVTITTIALLNDERKSYVVDRKTGMPLAGAAVKAKDIREGREIYYKVNKHGYFDLTVDATYDFQISYKGDTIVERTYVSKDALPDEVFDGTADDDLVDFFDDNASVQIFTDRSIYRPGQQVFYKVIFLTRDPDTGATLIMDEQRMRPGKASLYFKEWLQEKRRWIYIRDPFNRAIDSLEIKPNEYGSINGKFTIPKNAATGEWEIDPAEITSNYRSEGVFHVEEYKRPTYELTVAKHMKAYTLNDTLSFTVQAKSFAGVRLSNMPVKYTIRRSANTLLDSVGHTDDKGQLEIRLYDTSLQRSLINENDKQYFRYELSANATDATGESHEVEARLDISTRPVNIYMNVANIYHVSEWKPVLITTKDANGVALSKELSVSIYKLPLTRDKTDFADFSDQYIYPKEDLQKWFPQIGNILDQEAEKEQLVYQTTIHTADFEKVRLPKELLTTARYRISVICRENGKIKGEAERIFRLFETKSSAVPDNESSFCHLPLTFANTGDTVVFYSGSRYDSTYVLQQLKYFSLKDNKLHTVIEGTEKYKRAGVTSWKWKIPEDAVDQVVLSQAFIVNNVIYNYSKEIEINAYRDNPQIIIEQFRRDLIPGSDTTFSVSVKTKNKNVAAELMSVMYDASLDRIEKHHWNITNNDFSGSLSNSWPSVLSTFTSKYQLFRDTSFVVAFKNPWRALEGRVPGIAVSGFGNGFIEVTAYGAVSKRYTTASYSTVSARSVGITIRGINSLLGNAAPMILLDGVPYTGKLSDVNVSELTEVVILKDADATAIYGSRGANGVLLLSTKGPIVLPVVKVEVPVKIRSNFNETAFFFPAVYADKEGYYRFPFTIPESTTEWNWKLLAHTKNAQFAYAERTLNTHLPLMVQPNMPRLLYQGDKMILQTRISNLDSLGIKGTVSCKVEDEVTGEDLTAAVVATPVNAFEVNGNANKTTSFTLTVPGSQLHPVKITITAQTGTIADGEEHIIPVLSKKLLVKETLPFRFIKADTVINVSAVSGELYGMDLSMHPLPQSAIINALPFLSAYSFNCAEQTFNKLYAHAMAVKIMDRNEDMQKVFSEIREKVEKDSVKELPASPWLDLSNRTKKQQQELFRLLDKDASETKIKEHLERLYSLQRTDGGLPWFDGGNSNTYISLYVLGGFGKLTEDSMNISSEDYKYKDFIKKLVSYCDTLFNKDETEDYIIARSYWKTRFPLNTRFRNRINAYLTNEWKMVDERSLAEKARLIIATLRSDSGILHKKALEELASLRQLAINDPEGLRWKDIADADDLQTSAEETLALLAEAFGDQSFKQVRTGILQWLLNTQTGHHWQTTKATAAAIGLLHTEKAIQSSAQIVDAVVGDSTVTVSNDLLSGNLFSFVKLSAAPATISLKKEKEGIAKGDLTTWYFMDWDQVKATGNKVQLSREFLLIQKDTLIPVTENMSLKVGDKVKVILHITSDKPLRYVYLEDKRAAAFEPADGSSGNQYDEGLDYYRSVRDDGSQFFIDFIPSGENVITYEQIVVNEGEFSYGPASMECMYRPDIHAYSGFRQIKTIKQ